MNIPITFERTSVYILEDETMRCRHDFVEIEPPCCDGTDCGCHGLCTVYCPDCENKDMTETEKIMFLIGSSNDER